MYMRPEQQQMNEKCCHIAKTVHTSLPPMVNRESDASKTTMRMRKHGGSCRPKVLFEGLACSENDKCAGEKSDGSIEEEELFSIAWKRNDQDKENLKRKWNWKSASAPKACVPVSPTLFCSARSREVSSMPVPSKKRSSSPSPDPPCKKALNYDNVKLGVGTPKSLFGGQKSPQQLVLDRESSNGLQRSPLFNDSLKSLSLNGSPKNPLFNGSQKSGTQRTPLFSVTPPSPTAGTPTAKSGVLPPATPPNGDTTPTRKHRTPLSLQTQQRQLTIESVHSASQRMRQALNIRPSMLKGKARSLEDRMKNSKLIFDVNLSSSPTSSVLPPQLWKTPPSSDKGAGAKTELRKLPETSQSPDSTTNLFLVDEQEIVNGPFATREETITLTQDQDPEERREPHMIGFSNPGNLCWMNSVVQCVVSLAPLMGDIQEYMAGGGGGAGAEPVKYSNVLRCLLKILSMRQQGHVARVNDTLRKFHKSLEAVKQEFATDTQQDCPEFLTELLDHLRDEFFRLSRNSAKGATLREISDNARDDTAAQRDSVPNPIRDNTEITMKQQKKCTSCSEVVVGEIREPILIVDVPDIPKCSLQHALKGYFKSADIERQCDSCSSRTSTTATSISRLPRVLTVQLKRYICKERTPESAFSGIEKVNSRVRIPEWLSVQDIVTDSVQLPCVRVSSPVAPISVFLDESSNQEERELEEAKLLSLADDEEEQIRQALAASMLDAPRSLPGSVNSTPVKDNATTPVKEDEPSLSRDYRLVAFIQHMGSNPNSGHYTSTVYNIGLDCWMNYNDADVQRQTFEVATGDRAQKNGYIFFYLHRLQFEALAGTPTESAESG